LPGEFVEIASKPCVGRAILQLVTKARADEPPRASTMRDDVGDRLAAYGQRDALSGTDCIDHLTGSVA
jgi:hypothetical protein